MVSPDAFLLSLLPIPTPSPLPKPSLRSKQWPSSAPWLSAPAQVTLKAFPPQFLSPLSYSFSQLVPDVSGEEAWVKEGAERKTRMRICKDEKYMKKNYQA